MTKVYASGETPAVGDVVRRSLPGCLDVGGVYKVSVFRGHSVFLRGHGDFCYEAHRFTLIARAGEQVTFQSGDVVECVDAPPGFSVKVGSRYTVGQVPKIGGMMMIVEAKQPYYPNRFRLVHRPDAPAAVERLQTERAAKDALPLELAPTTAEIVATLRHGDRVRYVIESTVDLTPRSDDALDYWLFDDADVMAGTIEILSRAAPCPPAGKLTSTDDLLPGDILVCTTPGLGLHGEQVTVKRVESASLIQTSEGLYHPSHFAFVRRPQ